MSCSSYKTRLEIEKAYPFIKHGGWPNLIRKAKLKHTKKSIKKGRLRYLYHISEISKIVAAAKTDKRCTRSNFKRKGGGKDVRGKYKNKR